MLLHTSVLGVISLTIFVKCEENLLQTCRRALTYGYGYQTLYHFADASQHNNGQLKFEFFVKTKSNAHILLSPTEKLAADNDPVYEIVIGGGRNSFSEIRRGRRYGTVARDVTENIVSEKEFKGFWINVNVKDSRIEVGTRGSDDPFLFYVDANLLKISYFSFCTWTGVLGDWLYNCPDQTDNPEIQEVEANRTALERLRLDVLAFNDPYVLPIISRGVQFAVNVHLHVHHVEFDEKKLVFKVFGVFKFWWMDGRVKWNPSEYDNITEIKARPMEIWTPNLYLYNSATTAEDVYSSYPMINIKHDGNVTWSPPVSLSAWCEDNDFDKWPQDKHVCHLVFSAWMSLPVTKLKLVDTALSETVETTSQWSVKMNPVDSIADFAMSHGYALDEDDVDYFETVVMVLEFDLKRIDDSFLPMLWVPFFAVSTMILSSFWLSPNDISKTILNCINMVILVMLLLHLSDILPAMSDSVPNIVKLYSSGVIVACVPIVLNIWAKNYLVMNVPDIVVFVLDCLSCCLPSLPQGKSSYGKLKNSNDRELLTDPRENTNDEDQNYSFLLVIAIERIFFFLYLFYVLSTLLIK